MEGVRGVLEGSWRTGLAAEADPLTTRLVDASQGHVVDLAVGMSVLLGSTVGGVSFSEGFLDGGGVFLHVFVAHVVGCTWVGGEASLDGPGLTMNKGRAVVVILVVRECLPNVVPDRVLLCLGRGWVARDNTAWGSDGVVGCVGITRAVLHLDPDVVVLRMREEVLSDEVGMDLELIWCQARVAVGGVDVKRAMLSFTVMLCWGNMVNGVVLSVTDEFCV